MYRKLRTFSHRPSNKGATFSEETVDDETPPLPDPEDDPQWLWLRDRVRALEPMRDVHAAVQDCQVAVARLADQANDAGAVGEAAERALQSLALDVHHECRRARDGLSGATFRGRLPFIQWLLAPVDSGEPVRGSLSRLRAVHGATAVVRAVGAVAGALLLWVDVPLAAAVVVIASLVMSGLTRYRTNAECVSTLRARYFSCLAGHVGDVVVNAMAAVWLTAAYPGRIFVAPLLMIALHLMGTIARTGALAFGVHVQRLRMERFIRLFASLPALLLAALGFPQGYVVGVVIMLLWFLHEVGGAFVRVWEASATEFAWTALTQDGFTTDVLTTPDLGGGRSGHRPARSGVRAE